MRKVEAAAARPSPDFHQSLFGERPTVDQRLAEGKAIRRRTPRHSHALYAARDRRKDPLAIIESQAATRLPQLVPIRHARMLASPFAFFRGSAAIMAADLAKSPTTGVTVQACGDAHVLNFGVFASAERELIFAINDFDETFPAAWEWDLKRLVASAAVAARFLGGDCDDQVRAARAASASYRTHMRKYARMGALDIWYSTITADEILKVLSRDARKRARAVIKKARKKNHLQVLEKLTDLIDHQRRIIEVQPLIIRETHTSTGRPVDNAVTIFLDAYLQSVSPDRRQLLSHYRVVDVARKVVGVGSVGTRCWMIFLEGADETDPLFLQVKEAQASVLAPYFAAPQFLNEGERVVFGQRLIQGSPDIFLGWCEIDGTQVYVRQLRDMKGGVELIPGEIKLSNFVQYCELCGWALALAHAKSGDAAKIAGYVGKSQKLDEALGAFALAYADQNDRDYERFVKAVRSGRIKSPEGTQQA